MVKTIPFDTLSYAKALTSAGLSEEQAEVQVNALAKALTDFSNEHLNELAKKSDLRELELRLKHDLTLRLGGMLVIGIGIVATLVKIL